MATLVDRTCVACGAKFQVLASQVAHGRGRCCSRMCNGRLGAAQRNRTRIPQNRDKKASDRAYYAENREEILRKLRTARNSDAYRARKREWHAKNKERINARLRKGRPPLKTAEQKQERYRRYRLLYDYGITLDR